MCQDSEGQMMSRLGLELAHNPRRRPAGGRATQFPSQLGTTPSLNPAAREPWPIMIAPSPGEPLELETQA